MSPKGDEVTLPLVEHTAIENPRLTPRFSLRKSAVKLLDPSICPTDRPNTGFWIVGDDPNWLEKLPFTPDTAITSVHVGCGFQFGKFEGIKRAAERKREKREERRGEREGFVADTYIKTFLAGELRVSYSPLHPLDDRLLDKTLGSLKVCAVLIQCLMWVVC
jgi:hypothetical protein